MKMIDFPEIHFPIQGLDEVTLPRMARVRQLYASDRIEDIPAHLRGELARGQYADLVRGKRIAVTVGSRGIPHNAEIVRTICAQLKDWGAAPFIVPAMGSHGGGTVAGNLEILAGYGITEANVGAPICASMDVVQIGALDDGADTPVYCDRFAAEADGIVVYNKVKPHTDFKGEHESGLLKMMAIGLAKHKGCSGLHRRGFDTFAENIPKAAKVFLAKMPVVFAVGVVQNAYDDISEIRVYPREKVVRPHRQGHLRRGRGPERHRARLHALFQGRLPHPQAVHPRPVRAEPPQCLRPGSRGHHHPPLPELRGLGEHLGEPHHQHDDRRG